MPHLIVKMHPGRSEELKQKLAEALTRAVNTTLNCEDKWISVAVHDVVPDRWAEEVYQVDILDCPDNVYKKPGYNPFEK
jgi:4-oxalocrotonate tautomerase